MSSPYVVVNSHYLGELEREVADFLKHGYTPLGGVAIVQPDTRSDLPLYAQAMFKPANYILRQET